MTESPSVIIEERQAKQGKIGVLTLNSPKTLNSLTLEMVETLSTQLSEWDDDSEIALVILQGAGEKAFCAGGDVQKLYESAIEKPGGPCEYGEEFFLKEYILDYQIHCYRKPVLCLGNGIVMGGGLGLMAGASHRVSTDSTRIAMPEITIGLYPDVGGTYFLNNMPFNLGYFFGLTGAPLNGHDALVTNLSDVFIPSNKIDEMLSEIDDLSWEDSSDEGIEVNHKHLTEHLDKHSLKGNALTKHLASNILVNLNILETICQQTSLSEIVSEISNHNSDNKWLAKAAATLRAGSPLSSLIIYEQLKRHKSTSLRDVFIEEYQLSTNIIRFPEFAEGVRALLIDKDNAPAWQFKHFSDITSSLIDKMFSAPWKENPLLEHLPEAE